MSRDIFATSEAEFLGFVATFNAGAIAHADLLGIPATLTTENTAKLLPRKFDD